MYNRADALCLAAEVARRFEEPAPHLPFPNIIEFFVFGSASCDEKMSVGDLDIGLLVEKTEEQENDWDCKYSHLTDRFEEIERTLKETSPQLMPIDFEVIELGVLWDSRLQKAYAGMAPKNFISNILSSFLRWDSRTENFQLATRPHLNIYRP
jgi:hypothetical protein